MEFALRSRWSKSLLGLAREFVRGALVRTLSIICIRVDSLSFVLGERGARPLRLPLLPQPR
jgi:hypothetical protein